MYRKRVVDVNRIYDRYARSGLSNREIWRRYIYPTYRMSERTFYMTLNAAARVEESAAASDIPCLFDLSDKDNDNNRENDE